MLLVNVLGPVAAGEKVTPEKFNQLLDQISEAKHQLAAKLQQAAERRNRSQKNPAARGSGDLPFFRWRVYGAREASQGSALRSDERAKNARP